MCVTKPQMLFRVFDLRPCRAAALPSAEGGGPSVKQERSSKGFSQQICEMPTCQAKRGEEGGPGWQIYFDSPFSLFKAIVHQKRGTGLEGLLVEAVFSNERQ